MHRGASRLEGSVVPQGLGHGLQPEDLTPLAWTVSMPCQPCLLSHLCADATGHLDPYPKNLAAPEASSSALFIPRSH